MNNALGSLQNLMSPGGAFFAYATQLHSGFPRHSCLFEPWTENGRRSDLLKAIDWYVKIALTKLLNMLMRQFGRHFLTVKNTCRNKIFLEFEIVSSVLFV